MIDYSRYGQQPNVNEVISKLVDERDKALIENSRLQVLLGRCEEMLTSIIKNEIDEWGYSEKAASLESLLADIKARLSKGEKQ